MGADSRDALVLRERAEIIQVRSSAAFAKIFGRSLKMRQVSSEGCNGCELGLNAATSVNFDIQPFGIEWAASPRHADALVATGPLTRSMQDALQITWEAMPEPRFAVAAACTDGSVQRRSHRR